MRIGQRDDRSCSRLRSGAARLGEAAEPVAEPVGTIRNANTAGDSSVVQVGKDLRVYAKQVLDRHRPGPDPAGQPAASHVQSTGQHRVRPGSVFGAHLNWPSVG